MSSVKRFFIALAIGVGVGVFFMNWNVRHAFPTEEEIKTKIHPGMTREEMVHALGDPASEHRVDTRTMTASYMPAVAMLDKWEPGYVGFVVTFSDGLVRDWRVLTGKPSYDPSVAAPRLAKWWLVLWPTFCVIMFVVGWIRGVPVAVNQRAEMLQAFAGMKIAPHLPADFAFITHETDLLEVVRRAGSSTREINFVVRPEELNNYPLVQTKNGSSGIRTLAYDLPDSDSLIVMPEYPFEDASHIRAVYRWRGGAGPGD